MPKLEGDYDGWENGAMLEQQDKSQHKVADFPSNRCEDTVGKKEGTHNPDEDGEQDCQSSTKSDEDDQPSTPKDKENSEAEDISNKTLSPESNLKPLPSIARRVEIQNEYGAVIFESAEANDMPDTKQASPMSIGTIEKKPASVLEIVDRYRSLQLSKSPDDSIPPISRKMGTMLVIHSKSIIRALKSVCEYYPDLELNENRLQFEEPYIFLIHHQDKLVDYRKQLSERLSLPSPEMCEIDQDMDAHLLMLQDTLDKLTGSAIAMEQIRLQRKTPVCSFNYSWLLFKPGTDVYIDSAMQGIWNGAVVRSCNLDRDENKLVLVVWYLESDGDILGRREETIEVPAFQGEKEILRFPVFPCSYFDEKEKAEGVEKTRRQQLIKQGEMYWNLLSRKTMDYDGLSTTFPKRRYVGKVVVDLETYYLEYERPALLGPDSQNLSGVDDCHCSVCTEFRSRKLVMRAKFADYDKISPLTTKSLTEHQYFLCTREIPAYILKIRSWKSLDVASFSPPTFDRSMIDRLVLDDEMKNLIRALTLNFTRTSLSPESHERQWSADFVPGKGDSLIFLLHGSPGIGKTFTAECIAEYTQRPLLSLSCSNIGTSPMEIEGKLISYFKMAQLWGAILLFDEADIYLEKRNMQDMDRNSLVSVFLQTMEYYQGIMFLTTNRIGTFDDAFTSRIHVPIHYPEFTEETRKKIWRNFFTKLEKERGHQLRIPIGTKEYATDGKEIKAIQWNGREIRNAFQTAVALAEFDAEKDEEGRILLKDTHLMQVLNVSKKFKDYLNTIHCTMQTKKSERRVVV